MRARAAAKRTTTELAVLSLLGCHLLLLLISTGGYVKLHMH
jgi:hypothetical protein